LGLEPNRPWSFWGGVGFGVGSLLFAALIAWSLVWKGMALWRAARHEHKWWFIALLLINTAAFWIFSIFTFSARRTGQSKKHKPPTGDEIQ